MRFRLLAALVLASFVLIGAYTVIARPAPPASLTRDSPGDANSVIAWSSGWVTILPGTCAVLDHDLGGDPENYAVEFWFWDPDDGLGLNRRYYGGAEYDGHRYGVYWQELTANTIEVCRQQDDYVADRVRIRMWLPAYDSRWRTWRKPSGAVPGGLLTGVLARPVGRPAGNEWAPAYDSGWRSIGPGQTITFTHGLGITATELVVGLWFSGTARGIHHYGYGGLGDDVTMETYGAHWHDLTGDTVQVTRHPHDVDVEQVRVIVRPGTPPAYDSLMAPGGWQRIVHGPNVFTHGLNSRPSMLVVRGECYSSTTGINQWFAGGNHGGFDGGQWQGMNVQNLTANTVEVYRQPDDRVCPQARVRVWKRDALVYPRPVSLTLLSPPRGLELPVGQAVEVRCQLEGESRATVEFVVNGVPVRTEDVSPGGVVTLSWAPAQPGPHTLAIVARIGARSVFSVTQQVLAVPPGLPVRIR